MSILFIPIMAFLGRACGASWQPKRYPAELVWAFIIALASQPATIAHLVILTLWGYVAMQLGHGRFYKMNGANLDDPNPEKIEPYIQKIYKGDITKPIYSWYCMGAKGFLIGLPLGIMPAAATAITTPLGYYLGFRVFKRDAWAEYIAWGLVGLIIVVSL